MRPSTRNSNERQRARSLASRSPSQPLTCPSRTVAACSSRSRSLSHLGRRSRPFTGDRDWRASRRGLSPLLSVGAAASRPRTTARAADRRAVECGSSRSPTQPLGCGRCFLQRGCRRSRAASRSAVVASHRRWRARARPAVVRARARPFTSPSLLQQCC